MKIGIIATPLDQQYAGIHIYTKNLIEHLLLIDHTNEYFLFRKEVDSAHFQNAHQIAVPSFDWIPVYNRIELFHHIPKMARKLGLDLMIEPSHFGPFNLPKSIKRVTVIHDLTPLLLKHWHTFYGWFLQTNFLPGIIRRADLIITNSEYTKQDIVKHIGKDPELITAALLGVNPIFRKVNSEQQLRKYGIQGPYILFQGTIEPRKNLVNLIRAYNLYRESDPSQPRKLVLSGKLGWKYDPILSERDKSKYKNDILLIGYVDREDMPAIYSHCDVFCYPSYYEGFGLPIIEAMACGARVVTSNTSSLPEVGGQYALYHDPDDYHSLARLISKLLATAPDPKMQEETIAYAKTFTWRKTAQTVLSALEKLK